MPNRRFTMFLTPRNHLQGGHQQGNLFDQIYSIKLVLIKLILMKLILKKSILIELILIELMSMKLISVNHFKMKLG